MLRPGRECTSEAVRAERHWPRSGTAPLRANVSSASTPHERVAAITGTTEPSRRPSFGQQTGTWRRASRNLTTGGHHIRTSRIGGVIHIGSFSKKFAFNRLIAASSACLVPLRCSCSDRRSVLYPIVFDEQARAPARRARLMTKANAQLQCHLLLLPSTHRPCQSCFTCLVVCIRCAKMLDAQASFPMTLECPFGSSHCSRQRGQPDLCSAAVGEQKCGPKSEPQRLSLSTCIGTCNEGGRWSSVQVRNHPVRADSFVILLCGNIDIDSIRQLVACA